MLDISAPKIMQRRAETTLKRRANLMSARAKYIIKGRESAVPMKDAKEVRPMTKIMSKGSM